MSREFKVLSASEMTRADEGSQELGIPGGALMERAGVEMARVILHRYAPERACVVAGGGNNGGDGFVVARELYRAGVAVAVLATREEYSGDPETNLAILRNLGVRLIGEDELTGELAAADTVIDALLGTGVRGAAREREAKFIEAMNGCAAPVVALDVPSGITAESGAVEGAAVRAELTVAAHAVKLGCVISPGREFAAENVAVEIGVPPEAEVEPEVEWTTAATLRGTPSGTLPRLSDPVHKYSAGALLVVAGSRAMTGAPEMVVRGADRTGCGIVFLAAPQGSAASLDARLTESIVTGLPEDDSGSMSGAGAREILGLAERASAVVLGPGLGTGEEQRKLVERLLSEVEAPVLVDADAITLLADSEALVRREHPSRPTLVTPHAGELGRLLGTEASEVSAHRLDSARRASERYGCCVLLKGSDTIIYDTAAASGRAGGRVSVNSTGSVALATAGTGDALCGVIGALLARGMGVYEAAQAGAWLHGRAAELWLQETGGPPEALLATDLPGYLPRAAREIHPDKVRSENNYPDKDYSKKTGYQYREDGSL